MAIISRGVWAKRLGVSRSTQQRLEKSDPDHPKRTPITENRVGYVDAHCAAFEELLFVRRLELEGAHVSHRKRALLAILHGTAVMDAPEEADAA